MNDILEKQIRDFIDTHTAIEETWLNHLKETNGEIYNFNAIKVKNIDIDIRKYIYQKWLLILI